MAPARLHITCIDTRHEGAASALTDLRRQLRPEAAVVRAADRQRTIDLFGEPLSPVEVVTRICQDVRVAGVAAVLDYSARLDGARLTAAELRVPAAELAAAHAAVDTAFLATVGRIRTQVLTFQRAILHRDVELPLPDGGFLRHRYLPLDRVGICVPGGTAAYPSTLLMTAVPAQAAGVEQLAVVAPPTPFGAYNPYLLATCHELGIGEVYRMGGAQAVAALAYGIAGIRPVDKIVGPGNQFVALAKRHVFGQVDIDAIAGPSEIVVIADETARPDWTAADLIAQAEHAPGSSVLLTWHEPLLQGTLDALEHQLARLDRGQWARQSLEEFGALILVRDQDEAVELANQLATEHLHIATRDPEALLPAIRHAGAIFLGHHSPVVLGDYVAGPSHVLPTGSTARFASGLSANHFLRAGSVVHFQPAGLLRVADDVRRMAQVEGLTGHQQSVDLRLANGARP
ncbi:MAG: histidinol dehydrogenase [Planctomycetes bacterium RBG_16_64_10]|nr:MAG: histidinol dehydrogenase [Planctomycetes bacterium RBG_16_64_10]